CTFAIRIALRFRLGARVIQLPSGCMPMISECACWEIWRISVLRYASGIQSRGSMRCSCATSSSKRASASASSTTDRSAGAVIVDSRGIFTNRSFSNSRTDRAGMHRFRSRTWSLRTAQQRQQCPAVRLGGIRMLEGEFVAEHLDLHDERIPFPAQHPEGAAQQSAQLLLVREPDGLGESD